VVAKGETSRAAPGAGAVRLARATTVGATAATTARPTVGTTELGNPETWP